MVFTHGLLCRPFSTAFLASSAAPIITDGLEVLVHEVIAAIATAPWPRSNSAPSDIVTWAAGVPGVGVVGEPRFSNDGAASLSETRSWGRFGPARDGTTVARSSSSFSE